MDSCSSRDRGNELADLEAKGATRLDLQDTIANSTKDSNKFVLGKVKLKWDDRWKNLDTKLHSVREDTINKWEVGPQKQKRSNGHS